MSIRNEAESAQGCRTGTSIQIPGLQDMLDVASPLLFKQKTGGTRVPGILNMPESAEANDNIKDTVCRGC